MPTTRILIVEDEGIIARDIQRQLVDLGYEPVDIAVDGEHAIALAQDLKPELVLMDVNLAGQMDGIEAAAHIRREHGIPCVFLTAYATNDVVERAKQADPSGYIIKPFDEQILRTTIEIALNKDRLDRQLRRSEAVLAEAQRMAHLGSWELDLVSGALSWSAEVYRIFEFEPGTGPSFYEVFLDAIHPDDREAVNTAYTRSVADRQPYDIEHRLLMKDGRVKYVRERGATHYDDGKPVRSVGTVQDVTDHRQAEQLLRLQSAALDSTTSAVVITDVDGTIQWVNPAFTASTGYTLEEAVGQNPRALLKSGVHDTAFYEGMWATILDGRVWTGELTNRKKDGSHYIEEQTITPVRNAKGQITHFVGVKRDLTEQKRLEQEFLQAQKMEVVGRLAGGIAHDFNNLLTVINGTCDLALMDLPAGHPTRTDFEEIRNAGDRAARLTQQLLTFSRKQVLNPAIVNASRTVTDAAKMLRRLIGEDIALNLDLTDAGSDFVFVDQSQLEQVLLNLAVNARDAMPKGGALTIRTRIVETAPRTEAGPADPRSSRSVELSVSDTGIGMSPEIVRRIFDPFFTTKREGKGTGLGLATVYGIVHQSNGVIDVDSEPGKGSTFRVTLPIVADPADAAVRPGTAMGRGGETVLLVEDEQALRGTTARMLESAGYRVVSASSGGEALRLLEQHPDVAIVVSDVVMPGLGGPALAAQLSASHPTLPVLLVSGYTDDKLDWTHAPGVAFLQKPFSVTSLTRKVRALLDPKV